MLTPMLFSVITTAELICMSETKRQQHSIPERKKKISNAVYPPINWNLSTHKLAFFHSKKCSLSTHKLEFILP